MDKRTLYHLFGQAASVSMGYLSIMHHGLSKAASIEKLKSMYDDPMLAYGLARSLEFRSGDSVLLRNASCRHEEPAANCPASCASQFQI